MIDSKSLLERPESVHTDGGAEPDWGMESVSDWTTGDSPLWHQEVHKAEDTRSRERLSKRQELFKTAINLPNIK